MPAFGFGNDGVEAPADPKFGRMVEGPEVISYPEEKTMASITVTSRLE